MKSLTEYLERAIQLESLAASEPDSAFKGQLLKQAEAYRKLAAKRAEDLGCRHRARPIEISRNHNDSVRAAIFKPHFFAFSPISTSRR